MKPLVLALCIAAIGTGGARATEDVVSLKPFDVRNVPVDIFIDIRESKGRIDRILVTGVRAGSIAEMSGIKTGVEVESYRGKSVVGLTRAEFQSLREQPLGESETSFDFGIRERWGLLHIVSMPIPHEVKAARAPAFAADRLSEKPEEGQDQTSVYEFKLKRPVSITNARALGDTACDALVDWQQGRMGGWMDEILWAMPVIKDRKMTAWQIAFRTHETGLARALRVSYFDLKGKPAAYPSIESDIRSSFDKSSKAAPQDIGLFAVVYDGNHAIGFFVGVKAEDLTNWSDELERRERGDALDLRVKVKN